MIKAEVFRAKKMANDRVAQGIQDVVDALGYRIDLKGTSGAVNSISAVGALEELWQQGQEELLRRTLTLTRQTWPEQRRANDRKFLLGIGRFITFQKTFLEDRFVLQLASLDPEHVVRKARDLQMTYGQSLTTNLVRGITREFNRRLAKHHRRPEPPDAE